MPENLIQKMKNRHQKFRLTHLFEYKFPANLTSIEMNIDNFFIL